MRNLLNPKWLFIINTLPIVVLSVLFIGQYQIINSLLKPETLTLWKMFGINLAILAVFNVLYTSYLILKKKEVSWIYAGISLMVYITYVYWYSTYSSDIIPFNIPRWMINGDMFLYVGTFLMPTMAYAILVLVVHFTPSNKKVNENSLDRVVFFL